MKLNIRWWFGSAALVGILLFPGFSGAQQKQVPAAQASISYDLSRETVLEGTVLSFTSNSKIPPLGSHVTMQTASGPVDVHLGSEALKIRSRTPRVHLVGLRQKFRNVHVVLSRLPVLTAV